MSSEGKHFSNRLQQALKDAGYAAYGPTELANQFNGRFSGRPVSVHAARKWLMGEAIPTQDKVRVLAEWLTIPAEWLRFGSQPQDGRPSSSESIDPLYSRLINDVQRLDEHDRKLVFGFVRLLIRANDSKES